MYSQSASGAFSDTSCNQLVVLTAEVDDDYFFLGKNIFHSQPFVLLYFHFCNVLIFVRTAFLIVPFYLNLQMKLSLVSL